MFQEVFRMHVESDSCGDICSNAFIVFDSMSNSAGEPRELLEDIDYLRVSGNILVHLQRGVGDGPR